MQQICPPPCGVITTRIGGYCSRTCERRAAVTAATTPKRLDMDEATVERIGLSLATMFVLGYGELCDIDSMLEDNPLWLAFQQRCSEQSLADIRKAMHIEYNKW